jgi:drug/metabolite transporter (DMT)-like permease
MVAMKGVIPETTPLFLAGVLGRPQPQGWRAWLWIGLFAVVDGALFQGFLATGLVHTGAGLGSVMIDSQPLVVALLALWLFGERIGSWGWLGLGLGVLGISLIGLPKAWILQGLQGSWLQTDGLEISQELALPPMEQWGEAWMLLAALAMAVGTVMIRGVARHADPIVATGWHMILGGLPLLGLSGLWETQQWQALGRWDWLALAYATVFGSAIAYGLFFYFASQGSLTSLSSLTFLTPVFALIFSHLFLSEMLTPLQAMGVCLTLMSIYLVNRREQLAQPPSVNSLGRDETLTITKANPLGSTANPVQVSLHIPDPKSDLR